jgi:glutamine synthetase
MGKKLDPDYFMNNVHKDGTHACEYLLACDINHETPPEVANWSSGYGDYHLVCDESSVRNHWIDG